MGICQIMPTERFVHYFQRFLSAAFSSKEKQLILIKGYIADLQFNFLGDYLLVRFNLL